MDNLLIGFNKLNDFQENLVVEAHGILGDLFIFGIIISIYDTTLVKREQKRLKEKTKLDRINKKDFEKEGDDMDDNSYLITDITVSR
ncbi:hypothetical protein CLV91_1940 [Maribacter vaceletii]|uniref:Uncharacterized protein n=1 Tax=Maribacter vaceletii TaxID=1206816 RepID=A0A495E8F4_9FLAO|nr:hypothetical protein [Maribacter vaceletii]RKR13225.1 hypothetical protein CLV91_1940 [Maribacter vaceletii]